MKKNLKQRIQENIGTFMYGRAGMDQLTRFLLCLSLLFLFASMILIFLSNRNAASATILQYAAVAVLVLIYTRAFSRNVEKRHKENLQFLKAVYPITSWFRSWQHRLEMRKNCKLFTCPTCKTTLRVPKGKGRINLTCPRCHTKFGGKS